MRKFLTYPYVTTPLLKLNEKILQEEVVHLTNCQHIQLRNSEQKKPQNVKTKVFIMFHPT